MEALSRSSDPSTSHRAAKNAAAKHPDTHVAALVKEVMEDGVPRTDPEIAEAVQRINGGAPTADRIRHGRLHLSRLKLIVEDGRKRLPSGATGRAWRMAE